MSKQSSSTFAHGHDQPCWTCQQFYSVASLAQMLDLDQKTLRRMITNGKIKSKRIGGSVRIPHAELQKLIRDY